MPNNDSSLANAFGLPFNYRIKSTGPPARNTKVSRVSPSHYLTPRASVQMRNFKTRAFGSFTLPAEVDGTVLEPAIPRSSTQGNVSGLSS